MSEEMTQIPDFETAEKALNPPAYGELLQQFELNRLTLQGVNAEYDYEVISSSDPLELDITRTYDVEGADTARPTVLMNYQIRGKVGRRTAVTIKATYRMSFDASKVLPVEFFAIYAHVSADLQVWPYLRELAYSLTSRMGIARLTLPLLTNPRTLGPAKLVRKSKTSRK